MTQKTTIGLVALLAGAFVVLSSALFIVDEREVAFIMQFGEAQTVHKEPGLKVKIPFVQDVIRYDQRLLSFDVPEIEVTAADGKRIKINLFTRYIITDPVLFFRTVRTQRGAELRLAENVPGAMLRIIGQIPLRNLFSDKRAAVMDKIHQEVKTVADRYGLDVKDVRIIAAEFPQENQNAIFRRMMTQRVQEAKLFRAQGAKRANEIQAEADRKSKEILATAGKEGLLIRGHADAQATRIYANAYKKDSDFFEFWRSMQAYREALRSDNTTYLVSPDGKFFKKFLK